MHFFSAYKTTSHTKPCSWNHVLRPKLLDSLPRATLNHVLETTCWDQNHLTHSPVQINPYNPPFKLNLGIQHTPPYHLGLSPDFTSELPGYACVTKSYIHMPFYMQTFFSPLILFFLCASWWLHHHHPLLHPLAFPCFSSLLHINLMDPLPHRSPTIALIPVVRNLTQA